MMQKNSQNDAFPNSLFFSLNSFWIFFSKYIVGAWSNIAKNA